MTPWQNRVTDLTRRMADDMKLRNSDIDSQRMQLRIGNGKGQKTRIVPMSSRLLHELREYWKVYRPSEYLFASRTADVPLQPTTIQKMFKVAAKETGILKNVTPHALRHNFATQLLEVGYDIRTVQELLGHADVKTTMIYTHVLNKPGLAVRIPMDAM